MQNIDAKNHVQGKSIYLDDIPLIQGTLFAKVYDSPIAKGKIIHLDVSEAEKSEGVVQIIVASHLKGENQIGGIIPDEPLLADGHVDFCGMPIALILAETPQYAEKALAKINCTFAEEPPIIDPRVAFEQNELIVAPKQFTLGDTQSAFANCEYVFEGCADVNGQEHLYIETQGAYTHLTENGGLKVYSSTQGPTAVQRAIAKVTGLQMHQIEVDVQRLGGGFGGKEDQANVWAALCAVGTQLSQRPVKFALSRLEDMRMTGKRHPYSADYKIGLDKDLKILAYEATFYQNAGAAADLSPAVLERTLFHCTNSYFIPNVNAIAYSCRTNLPPNTAFRGFGGPQGVFVIEAAIANVAQQLGIPAHIIQHKNLIKTGDSFSFGQLAESEAENTWEQANKSFNFKALSTAVEAFNQQNSLFKKGLAVIPICFGISFTKTPMNQARSLVHLYTDGSISVATGAVEMGQGVNTKILQVAAQTLGVPTHNIKIHTTNTSRISNTSPSAASATADLNGKATQIACQNLLQRLKQLAVETLGGTIHDYHFVDGILHQQGKATDWNWEKWILLAYENRINLSEHAHYATPKVGFNWTTAKGHAFAYHVYGTAFVQTTLDILRGRYEIDFVKVVHDFGTSMNLNIDMGQIEGGLVQGLGWMTLEELRYDEKGKLRSNALSTYKVPDIYSVPKVLSIEALETHSHNMAILNSKAVGEPPLLYGIGVYFALRNAILAYNPQAVLPFDAPLTPEKALMALYSSQ